MVINGRSLLLAHPIKNMLETKEREHGVSYGLSEAGYDIRVKQGIKFTSTANTYNFPSGWFNCYIDQAYSAYQVENGKFKIASAIEEFEMPDDLVGIVHDKSTWARQGLSVFNTVIEPGWKGFLTLELVYHGNSDLIIPAGAGIAQVIFHKTINRKSYTGKYQNQPDMPVNSVFES